MQDVSLRSRLDGWLAHHPNQASFEADVFHIRGIRLCVGCAITLPSFFVATCVFVFGLVAWPWLAMVVAGLGLAGLQAVSAFGWTRWRWLKVVVKLGLGLGLALAVQGVRVSPWPEWVQTLVLYGLLALVVASTVPRAVRLRRARASAQNLDETA